MSDKLTNCKIFVFDLDGTLYLGDNVFDGTLPLLSYLLESGRTPMYFTNNSSRSLAEYGKRLTALGFPYKSEDIITAGTATAIFLNRERKGKTVYAVATESYKSELRRQGIELTDKNPDIVLSTFDTEINYEKYCKAISFVRHGAEFIACNPDLVCPMPHDEVIPDCASISAVIIAATGIQPRYIGKPNRDMLDMIAAQTGVPNSQIAVVGDRLYTDIAIAENADAVSVCVLTGETKREMLEASPIKPQYVFPSVTELLDYLNLETGR